MTEGVFFVPFKLTHKIKKNMLTHIHTYTYHM